MEAGGAANSAANAANSLSAQVSIRVFVCARPTLGLCLMWVLRAQVTDAKIIVSKCGIRWAVTLQQCSSPSVTLPIMALEYPKS